MWSVGFKGKKGIRRQSQRLIDGEGPSMHGKGKGILKPKALPWQWQTALFRNRQTNGSDVVSGVINHAGFDPPRIVVEFL
jgi:hypothetical protein